MADTEQMTESVPEEAPVVAPESVESPAVEPTVEPEGPAGDADSGRSRRKSREGTVVSASMDRTAVVLVTEQVRHRRYNKTVRRHKRLYVHDQENDLNVGDRVRVSETRPLSKLKRWRLVQVLERAR